ncbi:MAG: hypothetical protein ACT4OL_02575 [Nitrospiraceae bacterium]
MHRVAAFIGILLCALAPPVVRADDTGSTHPHSTVMPTIEASCRPIDGEGFENIQIETSDIRLHEQLFEQVLSAPAIQRLDHPLIDYIRAYCFRGVLVVFRQDLRTHRTTGLVQLNFIVKDVASVRQKLESAYRAAPLSQLSEVERDKIVRFRMKPGVMRNDRKVDRLEVYGAEGFLIGFDQPQE